MMRTRAFVFPHRELPVGARQRAEANSQSPLSSAKNTLLGLVKCAGFAPVTARLSVGLAPEQEWYRRGFYAPLSLRNRGQGRFSYDTLCGAKRPTAPPLGELLSECEAEGVRYEILVRHQDTDDTPSVSPFGLPAPPAGEPRVPRTEGAIVLRCCRLFAAARLSARRESPSAGNRQSGAGGCSSGRAKAR